MFEPSSISQDQLHDFRNAAEASWADDTRHEKYIGHPQPSSGQCYVTSAWLKSHLGGHVGTKRGHYFWVAPDKSHVIDLTGDQYAYEPEEAATLADGEDEPWQLDPHQKTHRPGPVMYKRADHPLYKGFRVLPSDRDYDKNPRVQLFKKRADAALRGGHVAKHADLMGSDPYPGSTPQMIENDKDLNSFVQHDEPDHNPDSDLNTYEYNFVVSNGQIHVSPIHSHDSLNGLTGHDPTSDGPFAAGFAEVNRGHVRWKISTNIGLSELAHTLREYSSTVGWKFDGITDSEGGKIGDDHGPDKTMYYHMREGHAVMSHTPLPHGQRIEVKGTTAYVAKAEPALEDWAKDFGFKLAEYPGGGNMLDTMKTKEDLDMFNRGDTDFQPERNNPDQTITGDLRCKECGEHFDREPALREHYRNTHEAWEPEIEDGHFPQVQDFDVPLGFGTHGVPNGGETIAKLAVMCVPEAEAQRLPCFISRWDMPDAYFGAYRDGEIIAYAAMQSDQLVDIHGYDHDALRAVLSLVKKHYPEFHAEPNSRVAASFLMAQGAYPRYSKDSEPKDMIESEIPFIFDVHKGHFHIGYQGETTNDVKPYRGKFTPGGILEGYYGPGGKVVIVSPTNIPWTVRHFGQMWYHQFPQLEITSVEQEDMEGKSTKLSSTNEVGHYLKSMVASDEAAYRATEALKKAGGTPYLVGGAVRDALLGREPKDLDLMVHGVPMEQAEHALKSIPGGNVILTGKRFGVLRFKINGHEVEVALPRQDKYETSRRGEGVITVDHNLPVDKDLERRDFTANSMAVNLNNGQLIDPHGGARDIENHVLRTTHADSFKEDPSRLVRALVAHSKYGLNPDQRTRDEMEANGHLLGHESKDTIQPILDKLYNSGNPAAAIRLAHDTGVLNHLYPEVHQQWDYDQNNRHHHKPLGEHLITTLDNVSKLTTDPDVRQAALLHDIGKPASAWVDPVTGHNHYYRGPNGEGDMHEDVGARLAGARLNELRYPKARINRMTHMIQHHMFPAFSSPKGARKFIQRVGDDHADDMLNLREADQTGKGQTPEELAARTNVQSQRDLVDQVRKNQEPTDINNLAINGNDLLNLGMKPGPEIGNVLRSLTDDVVGEPSLNQRDTLLQRARTYINSVPTI